MVRKNCTLYKNCYTQYRVVFVHARLMTKVGSISNIIVSFIIHYERLFSNILYLMFKYYFY